MKPGFSQRGRVRSRRNTFTAACGLLGIAAAGLLPLSPPSTANAAGATYVYASFRGDAAADEKLWIYTSSDGAKFNLLANTGFGGVTGVVRDPSIMKHTDGRYYVAYTVQSWTTASTYFAIASSSDLLKWTAVTTVKSGIANTQFTWAPEWYIEGSTVRIICSIGTTAGSDFKPYIYTAQNSTLTSWSGPMSMGIGANHIDTFVVKSGSIYHAFAKDETGKWIQHASSYSLTSGWSTFVNLWQNYEAPAVARTDSGGWRIYVDKYTDGGIWSATSSDLYTWSNLSLAGPMRHGTVLRDTSYSGAAIPPYTVITGRQSSKVLDVQNPNTSDGANVGIYTSNNGAWQKWAFAYGPTGSGYYMVVNQNSGRCLDVQNPNTSDGANVGQYRCGSGTWQQWRWQPHGAYHQLISRNSGKCLDVVGQSTVDGANVDQWVCNNGANQDWSKP